MNKFILSILLVVSILSIGVNCNCAIEKDPTILTTCIQIDFTSILLDFLIKGEIDLQPLCSLADRYIECVKVVSKGCMLSNIGAGILTEIQNIALYCCDGITSSTDCILNPNVVHTCIDSDANVRMTDGSLKKIKSLEIGDQVKSLDTNGNLVDTPIVMIMDTSNQTAFFLNIETYNNRSIRVSRNHLIPLSNGEFKLAYKLQIDDSILVLEQMTSSKETIRSIGVELVKGYAAPVTLTGTILADDILVSCYALIESHQIAHLVMSPIRWIYSFNNYYDYILPEYLMNLIKIEKQTNGIHWYPKLLHLFTHNLNLITMH